MNLFQLINSDYKKYKKYGGNIFSIVLFTQGFWVIFEYRIASLIFQKVHILLIRQLLLAIVLLWQKLLEIITGISIPASVKIGHSFYIGHFGGVIINSKAVIGANCNISQGLTIGVSGIGNERGVPIIGNDVYIGANAVIAGKIKIGDFALIGACSLVNTNVEKNAVMLGVPAVKISDKGSKGYI